MRVAPSQEQFVQLDFAMVDAGILNFVPGKVLQTYLHLRRLTWRSETRGSRWSRQAFHNGLLAARLTNADLAVEMMRSKRTVKRAVATLKELGWVQTMKTSDGINLFILGKWAPSPLGVGRTEAFFADILCQEALARMEDVAAEESRSVRDLPIEQRTEIYREVCGIVGTSVVGSKMAPSVGSKMAPSVGSKMAPPTLNREEEEIENREIGVGRDAASPSPASWKEKKSPPSWSESKKTNQPKALSEVDTAPTGGRLDAAQEANKRLEAYQAEKARSLEAGRRELNQRASRAQNFEGSDPKSKKAGATTRLSRTWKQLMQRYFPSARLATWSGPEHGKVGRLVTMYGEDETRSMMRFLVERWEHVKARYTFLSSRNPTLGVLAKFHETFVDDGATWSEIRLVLLECERLEAGGESVPEELQELRRATLPAQSLLKMGQYSENRKKGPADVNDLDAIMRRAGLL